MTSGESSPYSLETDMTTILKYSNLPSYFQGNKIEPLLAKQRKHQLANANISFLCNHKGEKVTNARKITNLFSE